MFRKPVFWVAFVVAALIGVAVAVHLFPVAMPFVTLDLEMDRGLEASLVARASCVAHSCSGAGEHGGALMRGRRGEGDNSMEKYDGMCHVGETAGDDENIVLNVADMIGLLTVIQENLADDPCLMDLAPDISALREEVSERRDLAIQVAAEIDAEKCVLPN
mgnify:CR=1 FL=1